VTLRPGSNGGRKINPGFAGTKSTISLRWWRKKADRKVLGGVMITEFIYVAQVIMRSINTEEVSYDSDD